MTSTGSDHFFDADEGFAGGYNGSSDEQQLPPGYNEERLIQEQKWRAELAKLEEDIATLKTVLDAKIHEASQLKRRLGITPIVEIKDDLKHSIQVIRESGTYQKTNEKLHEIGETISTSDAYVKTNAALKSFGAFATKKLSEMRNSNVFKSVEERVGEAYTNVKGNKMSTSRSAQDVCIGEENDCDETYRDRRGSAGSDDQYAH